jgi:hypothetical protein
VAQLRVQVGERLVEQQQLRPPDQRPADRDALLLAARGGAGLAGERVRDAQHLRDLGHPPLDLRPPDPGLAQGIGQVLAHAEVRVEGEGLEHHRHAAPLHRRVGEVAARELDPARVQPLEPGRGPERRRLAGGTGAEQAEELPRPDLEADAVERRHLAVTLDQASSRRSVNAASPSPCAALRRSEPRAEDRTCRHPRCRARGQQRCRIPARHANLVFGLLLSGMMSCIVSGIATATSRGLDPGFLLAWMRAWGSSWLVAFPVVLVVAPLVRRLVARIVEPAA